MSNLPISNNSTKQHSFRHPAALSDYMDNFVEKFISHNPLLRNSSMSLEHGDIDLNPKVDVVENKSSYTMTIELPGLEIKDVHLEITDGLLTLSGEKKSESEHKKSDNYHVMERSFGYFNRSFSIPSSVNSDGIKADFKHGVLSITLPKSDRAQERQRKITINEA